MLFQLKQLVHEFISLRIFPNLNNILIETRSIYICTIRKRLLEAEIIKIKVSIYMYNNNNNNTLYWKLIMLQNKNYFYAFSEKQKKTDREICKNIIKKVTK